MSEMGLSFRIFLWKLYFSDIQALNFMPIVKWVTLLIVKILLMGLEVMWIFCGFLGKYMIVFFSISLPQMDFHMLPWSNIALIIKINKYKLRIRLMTEIYYSPSSIFQLWKNTKWRLYNIFKVLLNLQLSI